MKSPIYVKVVNTASVWRADTAAAWWCPDTAQEPAHRNRNWCRNEIIKEMNQPQQDGVGDLFGTFLVSWGRMTPSSQRRAEEKKAELCSSSISSRSSSCSPPGGSREAEQPGAASETLALGHRNRKLGSKARPHLRQIGKQGLKCCERKQFIHVTWTFEVSSVSPWHNCRRRGNPRSPPSLWGRRRRPPLTSWSPEPWCSWCLSRPERKKKRDSER